MSSKAAQKRVNAALRSGARPTPRRVLRESWRLTPFEQHMSQPDMLAEMLLGDLGRTKLATPVETPAACATCIFKQQAWTEGGYCYFWKYEPPKLCGCFEPASPEVPR